MNEQKLDHRRKYYMILDCETATLPFASKYEGKAKKDVAIAKPLIYDFAYQIIDCKGRVYRRRSYLVTEIFSVPAVFNTAYFASKRPIYIERLKNGEITLKSWAEITEIFLSDLAEVVAVGAYNSIFDFKKAIPFTEEYVKNLYSDNYFEWERRQEWICDKIAEGGRQEKNPDFDKDNFVFREKKYPLFDVMALSCEHLINNDDYKRTCIDNGWRTPTGKYFPINAEKVYAYVSGNYDFEESHTAIEDAEIESFLFAMATKKTKHNFTKGLVYFPFRILGKVEDFSY